MIQKNLRLHLKFLDFKRSVSFPPESPFIRKVLLPLFGLGFLITLYVESSKSVCVDVVLLLTNCRQIVFQF